MPQSNNIARAISRHLALSGLPLGVWFIAEYLVRNYTAFFPLLSLLSLPMMAVTIGLLYVTLRRLRDGLLPGGALSGLQAWAYGVQIAFFGGLIEALFIWLFNAYVAPGNLAAVHDALLQAMEQYQAQAASFGSLGIDASLIERLAGQMADVLREAKVETPIERAMSALSDDIFAGMISMALLAPVIRRRPEQA